MTAALRTEAAPSYEEQKRLAHHADPHVRRDLAGRSNVRPEILFYLTDDDSPDVRRAIAANAATPGHAHARLVRDGDGDVRTALAAAVARALPGAGSAELARARQRAIETLDILAQDQLKRVRQVLAETLKDRTDAPPSIINRLARDAEADVAGPILRYSPVLTEDDLMAIVRAGATSPALAAISNRKSVGGGVADAIAETRDVEAVAALLANPSAQIREETLDRLIDSAPRVEAWHRPLAERPRLPPSAISRMAAFVADSVLEGLRRRSDLDQATLDQVTSEVRRRLDKPADTEHVEGDGERKDGARPRTEAAKDVAKKAAMEKEEEERNQSDEARTLHQAGRLDEDSISDGVLEGRRRFAITGLSLMAGLPEAVVEKIVASRSGPGLTALAWKANLSPECAVQIQVHMGKLSPSTVLAPKRHSEFPLKTEDMVWQIEFFMTLVPGAMARA